MDGPGTLAPNFMVMPSSGWMRSTSALGSRPSWAASPNGRCGAALNLTTTSVARLGRRLPVRR